MLCSLFVAQAVLPFEVAHASSLTSVFRKELAGLELEPLTNVLADTVASTYPVASASSSVTYVYNPRLEAFERTTRVLGPILGERAETIGERQMNVGTSYSYVDLDSVNGKSLDDLNSRAIVNGRVIARPIENGAFLDDGRFTNFLPARVHANLDVTANIVSPFFTYGLSPNWDVNLTIPIVQTSLKIKVRDEVPDPRVPGFPLPADSPLRGMELQKFSDSSAGIGDILLRSKYVLLRDRPVDLALALGLAFPSGDDHDLQGTGTMRVQPNVILSRIFFDRIQPLLNFGIDINANDVDRSIFRWAAGGTVELLGPLTACAVFLGRHELSEQTDEIDAPFFFQIDRNDIFDAALGLRFLFLESGVVSFNALVPLNDDGLRSDVVPTVEVQYAFATR